MIEPDLFFPGEVLRLINACCIARVTWPIFIFFNTLSQENRPRAVFLLDISYVCLDILFFCSLVPYAQENIA